MFFKINEESDNEEKFRYFLNSNGIDFEEYDYSHQIFCDEEADSRIELYLDSNEIELSEDELSTFIKTYKQGLAEMFSENDSIIDDELLEELTNTYMTNNGVKNKIQGGF